MKQTIALTIAIAALLSGPCAFSQQKTSGCESRTEIAILGDSYSTYEGYIPEGNAIWYYDTSDPRQTDVSSVRQTWWWQLCNKYGYKLGNNESYSGATICYSGYDNEDYRECSFITRATRLGHPDIILVFGGTNDAWAGAPIGEYKYSDFKLADLYTFRPAIAKLLETLADHYPGTEVYFIINTRMSNEVTQSIKTICLHYGVKTIELNDIAKQNEHPNIEGMTAIADQVAAALQK